MTFKCVAFSLLRQVHIDSSVYKHTQYTLSSIYYHLILMNSIWLKFHLTVSVFAINCCEYLKGPQVTTM